VAADVLRELLSTDTPADPSASPARDQADGKTADGNFQ
jgi:hypothetical protein